MKKNIRKVPTTIQARLKSLRGQDIVAGCSRTYTAEVLHAGILKHLDVALTETGLELPAPKVPPAGSGKFSYRNVFGYEVVRKDLPKETHYNTVETPNYGDSYYGTHTVDLPYEKYPRDFYGPQMSTIKISSPETGPGKDRYTLVFEVERVLNSQRKGFEADLLEALNLLQENVGHCGVQKSGATFGDYVSTMSVSWEVLPPGTREEAVARIFRNRQPTSEEKGRVEERYDFLMSLTPQKLVYGMSGIQRYFGALLDENLVVFENIEYGNAIYIMFDDWKDLSKRTRTELLSGRFGKNFERIPHASGWKGKTKAVIATARKGRKSKGVKHGTS